MITCYFWIYIFFFFFQAEDGIRDVAVTGVQTCALPICCESRLRSWPAIFLRGGRAGLRRNGPSGRGDRERSPAARRGYGRLAASWIQDTYPGGGGGGWSPGSPGTGARSSVSTATCGSNCRIIPTTAPASSGSNSVPARSSMYDKVFDSGHASR